uniref:Uncharacterized protein n=1 Tax=Ixodes ricinus TaxID=34613 RepID=A0A147BGV5_IXORI
MRRAVVWILAHVFRSSFSECSTVGATCRTLSYGETMIEKLEKVEGAVGKENDLVLKPAESSDVEEVVVFFGGDTQDFPEAMMKHRDNRRYVQWNLEYMATLMGSHFPQGHCIVVRPRRLQFLTFSCYDNFVSGNDMGAPTHEFSVSGLEHFHKLLMNTAERLKSRTSKSWHGVGSAIQGKPLVLIGFSKGCVVLNQILYAIKALELNPDDDLCAFVGRIRQMYWLDGGHSGGSNTWVTKEVVLKAFAQLDIKVNIHVTPYQVLCNSRPWIGKEEKGFREMLKKLGMDVSRKLHYADEQPSLDMHFKLLEEFMPCAAPVR